MALPNIAQPSGNDYSPNSAALQQMGASVNDVRKMQDQNQAIMKLLDTVSTRLGNVTNLRTNIQSGIFEAFGNNFISRGMTQITEGLSDAFDKLIHGEEEQKEDPVVAELKKQNATTTAILESTQKQLTYNEKNQLFLTDQSKVAHEILALTKHPRVNEQLAKDNEKQRSILYKQENTLKEILHALSSGGVATKGGARRKPRDEDVIDVEAVDVTMQRTPRQQEFDKEYGEGEGFVFGKKRQQKEESTTSKKRRRARATDDIFEVPPQTETRATRRNPSILLLTNMSKDINESKGILKQLLAYQIKSSENLSKMTHAEEEAKTEATVQQAEKEANVEVDNTAFKPGARQGATDFFKLLVSKNKSTMSGAMAAAAPTSALSGAEEAPATEAPAGPSVDMSFDLSKNAPTKTPPAGSVGKSAGKLARIGKFAKTVALPAAIMAGATYAADAGLGAMGIGKDEQGNELQVDTKQDDANWEKMKWYQKAESGVGRGIEKVGSFLGMSNIAKQAQADRIRKETEYLAGKDTESSVTAIDEKQKALRKPKEVTTKDVPSAGNTTLINNQTIFPNRAIVKNTDDSYNRYLNSVLS